MDPLVRLRKCYYRSFFFFLSARIRFRSDGPLPSDEENHEMIELVSSVTLSSASMYDFVIL